MGTQKPSGAPAPARVGTAQAVRDVFITSINKGQFPFAIVGAVLIVLVLRIPDHEVVPLIKWMIEILGTYAYLGYGLFVGTVFLWYFHAQRVRREVAAQFEAFKSGEKSGLKKKQGVTK